MTLKTTQLDLSIELKAAGFDAAFLKTAGFHAASMKADCRLFSGIPEKLTLAAATSKRGRRSKCCETAAPNVYYYKIAKLAFTQGHRDFKRRD